MTKVKAMVQAGAQGPPYSHYRRPPKVKLVCPEVTRTRQSEQDSCDINKIVARYRRTGVLPISTRPMFFGDVSELGDYQSVMQRILVAERAFLELPSDLRLKFDNDVTKFLDFTSDPANRDEMVSLGLLEQEEKAPQMDPDPVGSSGEPEAG